ncbi:MAG: DUF721 domain-containing protein [Bacteroidota bacterium]
MLANGRPLKEVVQEILKKYRLEDHLDETRVLENWGKICGPMIASHTIHLSVKNGILFISVDSAALRQELQYQKESLLDKLNKEAGRSLIRDIVFK